MLQLINTAMKMKKSLTEKKKKKSKAVEDKVFKGRDLVRQKAIEGVFGNKAYRASKGLL